MRYKLLLSILSLIFLNISYAQVSFTDDPEVNSFDLSNVSSDSELPTGYTMPDGPNLDQGPTGFEQDAYLREMCERGGGEYISLASSGMKGVCNPPSESGFNNTSLAPDDGNQLGDGGGVTTNPTPAAESPASTASRTPASDDTIFRLEQEYEQCSNLRADAELCCGQPEACIGRVVGADSGTSSLGVGFLQLLGGMAANSAQAQASMGIAAACKKMQTVSGITAAINLAMAGSCTKAVRSCSSSCESIKSRANTALSQLPVPQRSDFPPRPGVQLDQAEGYNSSGYRDAMTEHERDKQALRSIIRDTNSAVNTCATATNGAMRNTQQAIAAGLAAKLASQCEDQTGSDGLDSIANNDFNLDCSAPGAAANPVCQQQCSRPGAESDPVCAAYLANLNGGNGLGGGLQQGADLGDGTSGIDVGALFEDDQIADPDSVAAQNSGLAGVAPGGGGGLGGGALGGGGGGDYAGGGGAGGMLDFNSKILRGLSSGNGYSSKGGGGFRGYGTGSRDPASKGGSKFSLKDFLPGGKAAAKRGIAALGGGNPEIASKTDDIFKRISNKFVDVCLKDRLYDCHTLRRKK